jgi:F420H(2)-dependent quinone reductase
VADRSAAARFRANVLNPVLRVLLRSPAHRLLSGSVLLLEYSGRRSGRRYGLPVMYAAAGDGFVVMAGQPAGKTWWRNFCGEPQPVVATVSGKQEPCTARLLGAGSDEHRQAVEAYRRRFPKPALDPTAPVLLLTGPAGLGRPELSTGR